MARVPYYVDDTLGDVCEIINELGLEGVTISGYSKVGGRWAFDSETAYMTALNIARDTLNGFFDTDDEDDDAYAIQYLPLLGASEPAIMYWSTESGKWF